MQTPKTSSSFKNESYKIKMHDFSAFYDKYSGPLYGIILRIVGKDVIADNVLEKTFQADFKDRHNTCKKIISEFTSIANHARKKSVDVTRAIQIFQACHGGRRCIDAKKMK